MCLNKLECYYQDKEVDKIIDLVVLQVVDIRKLEKNELYVMQQNFFLGKKRWVYKDLGDLYYGVLQFRKFWGSFQ